MSWGGSRRQRTARPTGCAAPAHRPRAPGQAWRATATTPPAHGARHRASARTSAGCAGCSRAWAWAFWHARCCARGWPPRASRRVFAPPPAVSRRARRRCHGPPRPPSGWGLTSLRPNAASRAFWPRRAARRSSARPARSSRAWPTRRRRCNCPPSRSRARSRPSNRSCRRARCRPRNCADNWASASPARSRLRRARWGSPQPSSMRCFRRESFWPRIFYPGLPASCARNSARPRATPRPGPRRISTASATPLSRRSANSPAPAFWTASPTGCARSPKRCAIRAHRKASLGSGRCWATG